MRLLVKRTWIPLSDHYSQWESSSFDSVIWWADTETGHAEFTLSKPPPNFAPGLLRCYLGDEQLTTIQFDKELKKIGWTREKIAPRNS